MVKGLFIGLAVIVVLPFIPIVHFAFPFGPFIAGAYGINAVPGFHGSPGRKALTYGIYFSVIMGFIFVVAALLATLVFGFDRFLPLLWGGVVVATFYYGSMSALGAWYAELRAIEKAKAAAPVQAPARPRC